MINPDDAPEGFKAVIAPKDNVCKGCVFSNQSECLLQSCMIYERDDNTSVIFIKKESTNG